MTPQIYRLKEKALLAGVLAGLAHRFRLNLSLLRLLFFLSCLFAQVLVLVYIALALFLPVWSVNSKRTVIIDQKRGDFKMERLYRLKEGKKLFGVLAGLSDAFSIDVTLLRLVFALALIINAKVFIMIYLVLAFCLPLRLEKTKTKTNQEDDWIW